MGASKNVRALGVVLAASSALVLGVGIASTNGNAASPAVANMPVKLTVEAQCRVTATELNFGTVSFLDNAIDRSASFSVRCTKNAPYSVRVLGGVNYVGSTRNMKNAASNETIAYALFQDQARTVPWDPNEAINKNKSGNRTYDVFGRVPAQPNTEFTAGDFEDNVTIQVDY